MYLPQLVVCACLYWAVEAKVAGTSSGMQPLRASLADTGMAAIAASGSWNMNTLPGSKKRLRKLLGEQPHTTLEDPDGQDAEQAQREPTDPLNAEQSGNEPEDDAECEMHVDKLASVMMKKNIGSHKIKASEKQQLLASGWHVVDPEQPGAVKVVCGDKESHLGLAEHCLLWKDGKPTLKKEEEVAALMRNEYVNKDQSAGPGVQKVSCDYLRVFYIGPRPKPPPEEKKKTLRDDGQKLPFNIAGIDWKKQLPPGIKLVGMKLTGEPQPSQETKEENKDRDIVTGTRPRGHKRKCD